MVDRLLVSGKGIHVLEGFILAKSHSCSDLYPECFTKFRPNCQLVTFTKTWELDKMVKFETRRSALVYIALLTVTFQLTSGLFSTDQLNLLSSLRQSNTGKEVRLIHYTGSDINSASFTSFSIGNAEDVVTHIDLAKPMVLYIHGFQESPPNESIRTVADAYLRRGDHNFVLVDWSDYSHDNYISVLYAVKKIARSLARFLDDLSLNGFSPEALHIVGHSMGAQMAGFIGNLTNFEVPRITGLDPASPGYYQFGKAHLNPTNARFVDVIHTDGGLYGAQPATGTVDCYPNGGTRPQPGCPLFGIPLSPTDLCSHWRSWRFWAESLLNETAFLALKCGSQNLFLSGKCKKNERSYCGYIMPITSKGEYYLTTNAESPFGRGESGIGPN